MKKIKINLKRITAFVLTILIATSMTACTKNKPKNSSSNATSSREMQSSNPQDMEPPVSSELISSELTSTIEDTPVVAQPIEGQEIDLNAISEYENVLIKWGHGTIRDKENRPTACIELQKKYSEYGGLFIMPNDEKKMYLTFDEGYENGYTSKILDALKEKNCPAVFFVTLPYVKANPKLVQRMIDEGHVVGNHSVNHKSMPTLKPVEAMNEITGLHNYMVENFNYQMTLFRPPEGAYSVQTLALAKELGYQTVLWSYAYLDYDTKNQMGVEKAFPRVTGAAHNGAVYLLHAVSKDNADMMGDLVDNFRENGYSLELLK